LTVNEQFATVDPACAMNETIVAAPTGLVVIWTDPEVAPAGMNTLAGTFAAAGVLLMRVTVTPAEPATPFRLMCRVLVEPPITELGFAEMDAKPAGLTVKDPFTGVPPPVDAPKVTTVELFSG